MRQTMSLERALALFVTLALLLAGAARLVAVRMGRQPDGSFIVATGQRIEGGSLAFVGRPIDMAIRPNDEVFAVLNKSSVFLARRDEVVKGSSAPLGGSAGFRGLAWSPDGK